MINVTALADKVGMDDRGVKALCRQFGVRVNKGTGFYLVDEEDFNTKISKGSKPAKKRTLSKAHQKKMMEGKAKKN
tara:strand:+ start:148 stop:375 length:228 start_codon:yes stop_codon:yes gene_type:complete